MEHLRWQPTPFAQFVAAHVTRFGVLDIGCSGGIAPAWRDFGPKLHALGFDAVAGEVERLRAREDNPNVRYVAGLVMGERRDATCWIRNPTARVSYIRSQANRAGRLFELPGAATPQAVSPSLEGGSSDETMAELPWYELKLAKDEFYLPAFFDEQGVSDLDFVKIDVDGPDFAILKTLRNVFATRQILGAQLEVTFFGSEDPDHHTFHNTDRFMRACGFELFKLSTIPYSSAALPARYLWPSPGPTETGRPLMGDAVYLRDFGWRLDNADPDDYGPEKHAKLAALFAMFDLPDMAAEVLLRSRARLEPLLDVDQGLELLVRQMGFEGSYAEYMARFDADAPEFYAV
jgi:hypothetical protein